MKLKTSLLMGIMITVVFVCLLILTNLMNTYVQTKAQAGIIEINRADLKVDELEAATYTMLKFYNAESAADWEKKYKIARHAFENTTKNVTIDSTLRGKIISNMDTAEKAYIEYINGKKLKTIDSRKESIIEKGLYESLNSTREDVSSLISINGKKLRRINQGREISILTLSMLFAATMLMYINYLYKKLFENIRIIEEGTERISEGNLDYKIKLSGENEFQNFAYKFNAMTESLKNANMCLEDEIRERQRTEIELQHAMKRAEEANRAKSVFLANMSHEIRTPMNGIIGMIDIISMTELTDNQIEYLGLVKKSANSLLRIINDILDYSKIEANKIELENKPMNIRDVINDMSEIFSLSLDKKGIKLITSIDDMIPEVVSGDTVRLRQILSNLIGNAEKFTSDGSIEVNARLLNKNTGHVKVIFEVKDTGIGIPKDMQVLLFERFAQLDSSYRKKYQGTGLGLAICKRLTQMMGGEIWVESEENKGASFYFTVNFDSV